MVIDDVLSRLNFGVKKTSRTKKTNERRLNTEKELRLRVVPDEVKTILRQDGNEEKVEEKEDSDEDMDTFEILAGSNLTVDGGASKRRKKKKKAKQAGNANQRQEMVARLRKVNRMYAWGEAIPDPVIEWDDLPEMDGRLRENLLEAGIKEPSPIQMQSIPMMLSRRNILASAPTGSGKTLAFSLPLILDVLKTREGAKTPAESQGPTKKKNKKDKKVVEIKDQLLAIVLEPTRELAKQTYRQILKFSDGLDVRCELLEETELTGRVDIIVCTPNRLVHRLDSMDLSGLRWMVVDESDRLFENVEGDERCFRSQLGAIYTRCDASPSIRRAFFSATFSYEVEEWCKATLENVLMLCIGERNSANSSVTQELVFTGSEQGKVLALRTLLSTQFTPPAIVFVQSKERARQLMTAITSMSTKVPCSLISSEKTQKEREAALDSFRSGRSWVLVCTELLGRGLDLPTVNLVVNFDLPTSIVSYIHRIGRTGRAGRSGRAITYFTETDMAIVKPIAVVISQAGFEVPEYTLQLKAPNKSDKKNALKHAPKRHDISHMKKKTKKNEGDSKKEEKEGEKVLHKTQEGAIKKKKVMKKKKKATE